MVSFDSLQETDLFDFFGVHEVRREGETVDLKTGGFQEHVDIRLWLDAAQRVHRACLWLNREFVGEPGSPSPFAKDIAKSFVAFLAPAEVRAHVSNVVYGIWRLEGAPEAIRKLRPTDTDPPLPPVAPGDVELLEVYAGARERAEKDLGGRARLSMENLGGRLLIELDGRKAGG